MSNGTSETLKRINREKFEKNVLSKIPREEITDLYLNQNCTYDFLMKKYNITSWTLDKVIKEYGIRKPRKQSARLVLETKYKNAGSKENYDKQVYETMLANLQSKGITKEEHYAKVSEGCKAAWGKKSHEELQHINEERYKHYFNVPEKIEHAKDARSATNLDKYGVVNSFALAKYTNDSKPNAKFSELLDTAGIEYKREFYIGYDNKHFKYDFEVNDILIEINPWPCHNVTFCPIPGSTTIQKDYHYKKSKVAQDNGYRCIHVWDWDDWDKVISLLLTREKVYARNCVVKQVKRKDCINYLNKYHLQGYAKSTIDLGLYCNDELVSIMTFGRPRYNKNYEYELIRYCSHKYVVGGAEKLFSYFVKNYSPSSIISYCDNSKFNGDVYTSLGFELQDRGIPTRHWFNINTGQHITDNLLRQRGFDQLFGTHYGKGTSNDELMIAHGFVEIYDCGQSTHVWKNDAI